MTVLLHFSISKKSNTGGITTKRVTSGGAHLRGVAVGQHDSEETSQWCRVVGDTVFDLTGSGIEPQIFSTGSDV